MEICSVAVRFINNESEATKTLYFKAYEGLKEGDIVIVDAEKEFRIAKVVDIYDTVHPKASKWVIDRVRLENHRRTLDYEKQLDLIIDAVDLRIKDLPKDFVFRTLAKNDIIIDALYADYNTILKEMRQE